MRAEVISNSASSSAKTQPAARSLVTTEEWSSTVMGLTWGYGAGKTRWGSGGARSPYPGRVGHPQ
ncbi:hypothetical protein GCM10010394_10820 [Streptomyces crystallinus]|uniref:Uncharacterized protein n=1 Tax=Streptomyces crystallinus TaxID=68191 RepID=A0ABN1F6X3_9ACTN